MTDTPPEAAGLPPLTDPKTLSDAQVVDYVIEGLVEGYMADVRAKAIKYPRYLPRASSISTCEQRMFLEIVHHDKMPPPSIDTCKSFLGGELGHETASYDLGKWLRSRRCWLEQGTSEESLVVRDHDGQPLYTGRPDRFVSDGVHLVPIEIKTTDTQHVRQLKSVADLTRHYERKYPRQALLYLVAKKGGYWDTLAPSESQSRCAHCARYLEAGQTVLRLTGSHDLECEPCGLARGFESLIFFFTDCRGQRSIFPIHLDEENRAEVRRIIASLRRVNDAVRRHNNGEPNVSCALTTDPSECLHCDAKAVDLCPGMAAEAVGVPILSDQGIIERFDRGGQIAAVGEEYIEFLDWADKTVKEPFRDSKVQFAIAGDTTIEFKRMKKTVTVLPAAITAQREKEDAQYKVSTPDGRLSMILHFGKRANEQGDEDQ